MVGQHGILFAVHLIKDHFGDIVSKVCGCLLRKGSLTLQEIVKDTELTSSQVKNCLLVLIQHNCVQGYSIPRPGAIGATPKVLTMYMSLFENIIHRLRFVKFMKIVADDLGAQCEALVEGLLQHGRLTFEQILERALSRKGNIGDRDSILSSFNQLVLAHYVERCPKPEPFLSPNTEDDAPPRKRVDKYAIDTMTIEKKALEDATLSDAERFAAILNTGDDVKTEEKTLKPVLGVCQKRKHESLEMDKETQATIVEKEVLCRTNFEMFVNCLKKKACASYKRSRLGLDAGVVLEAMIESYSGNLKDNTVTSSLDNIFERLITKPRAHSMNMQHVRKILEELGCEQFTENQVTFYTIDLKSIIQDCQTDEVEAVVLKRYNKDAYRIFRLLANKKQALETEKIADVTFIDKKEANKTLYKLWKDNILHMEKMVSQEQRKMYFLWKVDKNATWGKILDDMYHAALNLNQRIAYNYEQDKEVADLPAKLRTNIQKEKYVRYSNRRVVLENSLLKIDDVIMFFHDFLVSPF